MANENKITEKERKEKKVEIKQQMKTNEKKNAGEKVIEVEINRVKRLELFVKVHQKIMEWIKDNSDLVYTNNYFNSVCEEGMPFYRIRKSKSNGWIMESYYNNINGDLFYKREGICMINLAVLRLLDADKGVLIKTLQMVSDEDIKKGLNYLMKACKEIYERIVKEVHIKAELKIDEHVEVI